MELSGASLTGERDGAELLEEHLDDLLIWRGLDEPPRGERQRGFIEKLCDGANAVPWVAGKSARSGHSVARCSPLPKNP